MVEIKFHGTGGHGIVVATKILADAAAKGGHHAQAFASYGAARRGGKVEGYVRVSDERVLLHSKVYEPDYAIIMDEGLAETTLPSVVKENSIILINSPRSPDAFSPPGNRRLATVDADRIAADNGLQLPSGIRIINTTMLGAIAALLPAVSPDHLAEAIEESGISQPQKNIKAAQEAYRRVRAQLAAAITPKEIKEEAPQATVERRPLCRAGTSPCEANCPAGEGIERTLSLIQSNRFEEALANIMMENPFPGVCGRVCFHPCQSNCNRGQYDEAIAINALERAAFDHAGKLSRRPLMKERTGKKVAIIGSGPAGMAGAYFLALSGHEVTVFEASPVPGGIPRIGIPEYRLPRRVVDKEMEQIVALGIDVRTNTTVGKDVSFTSIVEEYDACFIAIGAHRSMSLSIPGEDGEGVILGLEVLKEAALGVEPVLGARVAVIGGGNVAIDAARTAKRSGAQEVTIVYRRSVKEMPAYRKEVEAAESEGIKILYLTMPVQIHRRGKRIEKLECIKTRLGKKDKDGRRKPERIEGTNFMLDVDTVIAAVGETVEAPFLPDTLETIDSLIRVDYLGRTSVPGIYAGGDAATLSRTVTEAIASGKRAAVGIDIFLGSKDEEPIVKAISKGDKGAISMERYLAGDYSTKDRSVVSFSDLNLNYFEKLPRVELPEVPVSERVSNFGEVDLGLSRTEAIRETERCFHCGHCNLCENCYIFCPDLAVTLDDKGLAFTINYDLCKRCGICIEECPRHAICWEEVSLK